MENTSEQKSKYLTLALLAHVDSGKTTLSEAILYLQGRIRKLGRVDHKDAFLDTEELEKNRGITIFSRRTGGSPSSPSRRCSGWEIRR